MGRLLERAGEARLYEIARRRLIERLQALGVRDPGVLGALAAIPRHAFIPEALHAQAYRDTPLPIGEGQTISAPGVVAVMTEALELGGSDVNFLPNLTASVNLSASLSSSMSR